MTERGPAQHCGLGNKHTPHHWESEPYPGKAAILWCNGELPGGPWEPRREELARLRQRIQGAEGQQLDAAPAVHQVSFTDSVEPDWCEARKWAYALELALKYCPDLRREMNMGTLMQMVDQFYDIIGGSTRQGDLNC
jgi:hypothetical protein